MDTMRRPTAGRRGLRTVGPLLIAGIFIVSIVLLLQRLSVLTAWPALYGERGAFTVEECTTSRPVVFTTIECPGQLVPEAATDGRSSTLRGPLAAIGSTVPGGGTVIEVYYRRGEPTVVYPVEGRPTELARLVIGVVPLVFLVGGAGAWLAGWLLTHSISRDDAERSPFRYRFPQRFSLRPAARVWILVGAGSWLLDRYLVDDLLGTVGVA
jgi:hypothetical protein